MGDYNDKFYEQTLNIYYMLLRKDLHRERTKLQRNIYIVFVQQKA